MNILGQEHEKMCSIKCTNNDRVVEAEVDRLIIKESCEIFMAQQKIKMVWNGQVYVGNAFGFEFTTIGPKVFNIKKGRGH